MKVIQRAFPTLQNEGKLTLEEASRFCKLAFE